MGTTLQEVPYAKNTCAKLHASLEEAVKCVPTEMRRALLFGEIRRSRAQKLGSQKFSLTHCLRYERGSSTRVLARIKIPVLFSFDKL